MRRDSSLFHRFAAVTAAFLVTVGLPAALRADPPQATVNGGGTAEFLDDNGDPTGVTSQFSVGAVIRPNGTVSGHFTCMIPSVVTISGDVEDFEVNGSGGNLESVTLIGTGHGVDHLSGEKTSTGHWAQAVTAAVS